MLVSLFSLVGSAVGNAVLIGLVSGVAVSTFVFMCSRGEKQESSSDDESSESSSDDESSESSSDEEYQSNPEENMELTPQEIEAKIDQEVEKIAELLGGLSSEGRAKVVAATKLILYSPEFVKLLEDGVTSDLSQRLKEIFSSLPQE